MIVYSIIRLKRLNVVAGRTMYGFRTGTASEHPKIVLLKLNNEPLQPLFPTIVNKKSKNGSFCTSELLSPKRGQKKKNVSKLTFQWHHHMNRNTISTLESGKKIKREIQTAGSKSCSFWCCVSHSSRCNLTRYVDIWRVQILFKNGRKAAEIELPVDKFQIGEDKC